MGINTLSFDKSNDGETPEGVSFAIPFPISDQNYGSAPMRRARHPRLYRH